MDDDAFFIELHSLRSLAMLGKHRMMANWKQHRFHEGMESQGRYGCIKTESMLQDLWVGACEAKV